MVLIRNKDCDDLIFLQVDVIGGVPWEVVTLTTLGRFTFVVVLLFRACALNL